MDSTESVNLAEVVENCWQNVETTDAAIRINTDKTIQANQSRLAQLCENLMRNTIEHNKQNVTITVDELADGFYIEDDGTGIPEDERDDVFNTGYTTAEAGTGFGLSIVSEVVEAHGWDVRITDGAEGGARFEITDVNVDAERVGQ
jgi:signal transduction histidine kinase